VQVPCDEGVAIHIGPESCAVARERFGEALTGGRIGQPLSRERVLFWVLTQCNLWKATRPGASSRAFGRPGVVRDPGMCIRSLRGNREISRSTVWQQPPVRIGKAKWDRTKVHPVVLEAMKEAAANIGMKTMVEIPPGKIHNGWVWMWPSTGNFRTDYFVRAQIVRWGLSGNTLEEAVYIGALLDSENKPLMGEKKYTVRLQPPTFREPAFWSTTMYDYANNYTVENPINRYSLGSDDPLIKNADGTITLYFQSTSPGKDKEANWLPTPESGRWYMNMRAYAPTERTIASAFNYDVYAPAPIVEVK
jgi:hypothetical protein